jgi:hypothetical protein
MNQADQPEGMVRRVFIIRLWRSDEEHLELRGEVALVGKERPIYIRSLDELMDYIQIEMALQSEQSQERRAGLK